MLRVDGIAVFVDDVELGRGVEASIGECFEGNLETGVDKDDNRGFVGTDKAGELEVGEDNGGGVRGDVPIVEAGEIAE